MNKKQLMGLQRRVANAMIRYYDASPGMHGNGWRVGRLIRENVWHGRNVGDMTEHECNAALFDMRERIAA